MGSMFLNIYVMGSRPLARLRANTLVIGASVSTIIWTFYWGIPGWNTPLMLTYASLVTGITLFLNGLYSMAFEPHLRFRWERALQRHSQVRFAQWLVVLRFCIFWILFTVLIRLLDGRGAPDTAWFQWSFHLMVPLYGLRQILVKLGGDSTRRSMQIFTETVRLFSLYALVSTLMSYIDARFFTPKPGYIRVYGPGFYLTWTPAVLTGLAGIVMYFDGIFGFSERRKKG